MLEKCMSVSSIIEVRSKFINIKTKPEPLLEPIAPYIEDLVIGVESVFCWNSKGASLGYTGSFFFRA